MLREILILFSGMYYDKILNLIFSIIKRKKCKFYYLSYILKYILEEIISNIFIFNLKDNFLFL